MNIKKNIFTDPPTKEISIDDCLFYHVQEIPGMSEPTKGSFDLRKGVNDYLGHVDFNNKSVLELGPASGFLTFYIENLGGQVTCIDLSTKNDSWDVVPNCTFDWKKKEKEHMDNELQKVQNAFWFAHRAQKSKSKVINSHIYNLPEETEMHDIGMMGLVLLHLQNPFKAIQNICSHTKEKIIITDYVNRNGTLSIKKKMNIKNLIKNVKKIFTPKNPVIEFYPDLSTPHEFDVWWTISPEAMIKMAGIFGFGNSKINYHVQYHEGKALDMYTVVCERIVPLENCHYK
jgi:hypothetical protein